MSKACQQRADARVCAGFLPGHGVCRFPVKYCENGTGSLQFNTKSHEEPVVSRRQAARFAQLRPHQLPIPCAVQISKASLCDLWAAKQIDLDCAPVTDGRLYADRAYIDAEWRSHLQTERNVALITPRKRKKYDVLVSEDAVSTRISALRQPD